MVRPAKRRLPAGYSWFAGGGAVQGRVFCAPLPGFSQQPGDQRRLAVGVACAVQRELRSQPPLAGFVLQGFAGMSVQVIPEVEIIAPALAVPHNHMDVVGAGIGRAHHKQPFPRHHLAAEKKPLPCQRRQRGLKIRQRLHPDCQVKDRLGLNQRDRRAAHMLDIHRRRAQNLPQLPDRAGCFLRPGIVVGNQTHRSPLQTEHGCSPSRRGGPGLCGSYSTTLSGSLKRAKPQKKCRAPQSCVQIGGRNRCFGLDLYYPAHIVALYLLACAL